MEDRFAIEMEPVSGSESQLRVADQLAWMAGEQAPAIWDTWAGLPPTSFSSWAMGPSEEHFAVTSATSLCCWEMIMFAAVKAGVLTWHMIHELYAQSESEDWFAVLESFLCPRPRLWDRRTKAPANRGDIVLFDGIDHVAVATGRVVEQGIEVYSFWPLPFHLDAQADLRGAFDLMGAVGSVDITTIEAILRFCDYASQRSGRDCIVSVGSPGW